MPTRYSSPVLFRFQMVLMRCLAGATRVKALWGHSCTQAPQNQHSSAKRTMGSFPFSGLGIITSRGQEFTQMLQPTHLAGSNSSTLQGPDILGKE